MGSEMCIRDSCNTSCCGGSGGGLFSRGGGRLFGGAGGNGFRRIGLLAGVATAIAVGTSNNDDDLVSVALP